MKAIIAKHIDLDVRLTSRSGGVFAAIAQTLQKENTIIYGCIINSSFLAEHVRGDTDFDLKLFSGSKYIQSNMNDCFKKNRDDLSSGMQVLFVGTACQVAGLNSYLFSCKVSTEKLFLIDIVCHGVPSPKIWLSFIEWVEKKHNGKVESVNFRDKRYGWSSHFETVVIGGKIYAYDYFKTLFYKHYSLRPSCYECPYCNIERVGDIAIADAWGIGKNHSNFDDDRGCSLALINTRKGNNLFCKIQNQIELQVVDIWGYIQPNLMKPSFRPFDREQFWLDYNTLGFDYVAKKYGGNTITGNMKSICKQFLGLTRLTKIVKRILGK